MAFMRTILDNGTPTGHSEINSSGTEDEVTDAKPPVVGGLGSRAKKDRKPSYSESERQSRKSSHSESDGHSDSSSGLSDSESDVTQQDYDDLGEGSLEYPEKKYKKKVVEKHKNQPWTNAEPLSHQDMLEAKFTELRALLTDNDQRQFDKHLLRKTKDMMKHYQISQTGLIPSKTFKPPKAVRPASGKGMLGYLPNGPTPGGPSRAWSAHSNTGSHSGKGPSSALHKDLLDGEEYILIDGTGDKVKTRRVKFSNMKTESLEDGDPAYEALGSLGFPVPVVPNRPVSDKDSRSRARLKAKPPAKKNSTKKQSQKKENTKSRSSSRSSSADSSKGSKRKTSHSGSRSSRSRSNSSERSGSRRRSTSKSRKTDHHLKDTDNKTLQEWLLKKNKELKAKKKEERRKRKEKREQKRREFEEKLKVKEQSEEAVKLWMIKKEKEQRLLHKRERSGRPLNQNECSYSLELITVNQVEDPVQHHYLSNPEINTGAPFISRKSNGQQGVVNQRAKSAKPRRENSVKEKEEKRKKYDQWLHEKQDKSKKKPKKIENVEEKANESDCNDKVVGEGNESVYNKGEIGDNNNYKRTDKNELEVKNSNTDKSDIESGSDDELNPRDETNNLDADAEDLLTDFGKRRDVNMNIRRKDSDSFDPYDKPKDYTLDPDTRLNMYQLSNSPNHEPESPTKSDYSHPSFRMPSPPLLSNSPVPKRDNPDGDYHHVPSPPGTKPPRPEVPKTSAYRRIKREQASWDEFAENVWDQVNTEAQNSEAKSNDEEGNPGESYNLQDSLEPNIISKTTEREEDIEDNKLDDKNTDEKFGDETEVYGDQDANLDSEWNSSGAVNTNMADPDIQSDADKNIGCKSDNNTTEIDTQPSDPHVSHSLEQNSEEHQVSQGNDTADEANTGTSAVNGEAHLNPIKEEKEETNIYGIQNDDAESGVQQEVSSSTFLTGMDMEIGEEKM